MNKQDLIDKAIEEYENDPKEQKRRGRPRKGTNKELANAKIPSGDKPAALEQGTRAYRVSELLLEGNSVEQVAEILSVDRATIMTIVSQSLGEMYESAGTFILNWGVISMLRAEMMFKELWEKRKDDNGNIQTEVYKLLQEQVKMQNKIVEMFTTGASKDKATSALPTMLNNSKLYQEGVIELNEKYQHGGTKRPDEIMVLDDVIPDGIPDREHD